MRRKKKRPTALERRVWAALDRAHETVKPLIEAERRAAIITPEVANLRFCPPGHCPPLRASLPSGPGEERKPRVRPPMTYCGACPHVKNKHLHFPPGSNKAVIVPCDVDGCRCPGYVERASGPGSGEGERGGA